ncbi:hypothetical protein E0J16_34105 [Rhizobium pisi]|uniref:hypothetical protein n=1 Tax=Rhizobium pisi TaxID=574561 RepID=UPI0010386D7A|nr:hypothetical protein [Rhizobium pisi]TCA41724.1 hypothetical protein E0J16_34105 [Rhizobium pisi]
MDSNIADRLSREYSNLWEETMHELPNGWITPLVAMLDKLYVLSDIERSLSFDAEGLATWVDIRVEVSAICAAAYATPLRLAGKWNPARALACVEALSEFAGQCSETCSVCGQAGALRMPNFGDAVEGVLCDEHNAEAASNVDHAAELYNECRILFPGVHGKAIDLHGIPDFLFDLVSRSLRTIKEVVVDEGSLEGRVLITKLEMVDGQLHVRHTYNDISNASVGALVEIDDAIRFLESRSDELTRKYQMEGGSDATS